MGWNAGPEALRVVSAIISGCRRGDSTSRRGSGEAEKIRSRIDDYLSDPSMSNWMDSANLFAYHLIQNNELLEVNRFFDLCRPVVSVLEGSIPGIAKVEEAIAEHLVLRGMSNSDPSRSCADYEAALRLIPGHGRASTLLEQSRQDATVFSVNQAVNCVRLGDYAAAYEILDQTPCSCAADSELVDKVFAQAALSHASRLFEAGDYEGALARAREGLAVSLEFRAIQILIKHILNFHGSLDA